MQKRIPVEPPERLSERERWVRLAFEIARAVLAAFAGYFGGGLN